MENTALITESESAPPAVASPINVRFFEEGAIYGVLEAIGDASESCAWPVPESARQLEIRFLTRQGSFSLPRHILDLPQADDPMRYQWPLVVKLKFSTRAGQSDQSDKPDAS
jgi:hypothetical protein